MLQFWVIKTGKINREQVFNQKIDLLIIELKNNSILDQVRQNKRHQSWYVTIDSLTPNYGFSFGSVDITNKVGKKVGFKPYVKFYEKELELDTPINSLESYFENETECFSYLAKEVVYLMMRIENKQILP